MRAFAVATMASALTGLAYVLCVAAYDSIRWDPAGAVILTLCAGLALSSGLRGMLCRRPG